MKLNLNKIILNFSIIFSLCSCHTLEHQSIFLDPMKGNVNLSNKIDKIKNKDKKSTISEIDKKKISNKIEMAPIKLPEQKQKVKTIALSKKINVPKSKKFGLDLIKNWSEKKLIQKMGQSDFIKEEGKLKSYQYYFSSCFLDIFLLKKENDFYVNYIQTRSTKLYGKIEPEKCLNEINRKFN